MGHEGSRTIRDGARAALIIRNAEDIERLPLDQIERCHSLTVVGIPTLSMFSLAFAPRTGLTTASVLQEEALDLATRVARDAVEALPVGVAACHLTYASWMTSSFLATLRLGAFDVAFVAAWPSVVQRTKITRAIRAGGGTVVRLPC